MDESKKESEQCLSFYFQEDPDPELYDQSLKLRQRLSSSIDGVNWFLENFPYELPTTYISAYECFKYRLNYFSEEFNPEILEELKQNLFEKSIEIASKLPSQAVVELCNAQAYLSILIFPEYCPDLFNSVFEYPNSLKFRFLVSFCEYLILPTPKNMEKITIVKKYLHENNFYEKILIQIQEGIQNKTPDSIIALAAFIRWSVDISYLSLELINVIFSDNSSELAIPTLKMINSIAQRNIPNKNELIEKMEISNHIGYYIENYSDNYDIICECANTIRILGYFLTNPPLPEIFTIAYSFLEQQEDISDKMTGVLRTLVRNNPEASDETAVKVVERLVTYIAANPLTTFNRYVNHLFYILQDCYLAKPESFYNVYRMLINNIIEGESTPDYNQLSAFLAITNFMFTAKIEFIDDLIHIFFRISKSLLNTDPSLINEQLFFPVFSFLRTFIYRPDDQITIDYNKDVVKLLVPLSLSEEIPEEIRKNFETLFFLYVKRNFKNVHFLSEHLEKFLSTKSKEFLSISALVLRGLVGKPLAEKTELCFQFVTEELLGESSTYENLLLALSFLSFYQARQEDKETKQILFEILSKIFDACSENDESLASFCMSTKGLGEQGFEIYSAVIERINGIRTIAAIADVGLFFFREYMKSKNEEGVQNVNKIAHNLVNIFVDSTNELLTTNLGSDDVHQILTVMNNCYNLFILTYKSICEDQELNNKLLEFTSHLITERFNIPHVLQIAFKFLANAASENPPLIAQGFIDLSLTFILAPAFDPDNVEWEKFIMVLIEFHSRLHKEAYQIFSEGISKVFNSFEMQDFVERYSYIFEKDQREKFKFAKQFFVDILIARNSLTW